MLSRLANQSSVSSSSQMMLRLAATQMKSRLVQQQLPRIGATRNYATLKEVETRLKSIKNIEKITKTMKIVASTRLSKAEKANITASMIDEADKQFFQNAETTDHLKSNEDATTTTTTTTPDSGKKELIIAITSDKGLCGAIHSSLARSVRSYLNSINHQCDVVAIGDKIKMQLLRSHPENVKLAFSGIGKDAPTFQESALISEKIINTLDVDNQYNKISIYFNDPVSSLAFESTSKPIFNSSMIAQSPGLGKFDLAQDENVASDLFQYSFTNQILTAMAKGYAAEISARRNAMDNASKNAGDMISKYSILYNRTRQAVITNELVDIITGASSLD